jgi:hypothetical protein
MSERDNFLATSDSVRFEQFKLVYDYIKFHIGLYLATPPVFAVVAEAFEVNTRLAFRIGLGAMIVVYLVSGRDAGLFMGKYINVRWTDNFLTEVEKELYSPHRRYMHHTLYWIGLACGLLGLVISVVSRSFGCMW